MNTATDFDPKSNRNASFTRQLLAEMEDDQLQAIVEEAAKDLNTPIALVTMVMEHVQFFKAHYGLSGDLAATRGTDRDVSFCQFVVASEQPFEVQDARLDKALPQELVDKYDIRAYLGMPIRYQDTVVGSLCVLDTKPRKFSAKEQKELSELAKHVNDRLDALNQKRKHSSTALLEKATSPALSEIRNSLKPVNFGVNSGHAAVREIDTFLKIAERTAYGKIESKEEILRPLARAKEVLDKYINDLYNMEASLEDAQDSLAALEHAFRSSTTTLLSEIATSGRELARHTTSATGGVLLPDIEEDLFVSTPRPFGIALVSTTLSMLAAELVKADIKERIRMEVSLNTSNAILSFISGSLSQEQLSLIGDQLKVYVESEPTLTIKKEDGKLELFFSLVKTRL